MEKGYPLGTTIPREDKLSLSCFTPLAECGHLKWSGFNLWQYRDAFFPLKTPKPGDECQALQNPVHQQAQQLPCVPLQRLGDEAGHDDYSVQNLALLPTGWVWQSSSLEDLQSQLPAPAKVRVLEQPVWGVHWHHAQSFGVTLKSTLKCLTASGWFGFPAGQIPDSVFFHLFISFTEPSNLSPRSLGAILLFQLGNLQVCLWFSSLLFWLCSSPSPFSSVNLGCSLSSPLDLYFSFLGRTSFASVLVSKLQITPG